MAVVGDTLPAELGDSAGEFEGELRDLWLLFSKHGNLLRGLVN